MVTINEETFQKMSTLTSYRFDENIQSYSYSKFGINELYTILCFEKNPLCTAMGLLKYFVKNDIKYKLVMKEDEFTPKEYLNLYISILQLSNIK